MQSLNQKTLVGNISEHELMLGRLKRKMKNAVKRKS